MAKFVKSGSDCIFKNALSGYLQSKKEEPPHSVYDSLTCRPKSECPPHGIQGSVREKHVVLCRKNNGLPSDNPESYRFAVDYRKLNAVTKYPRYQLPLIEDLITNIPHTNIMSSLDLRSGYFQLAVKSSDAAKTAFVNKNGTFAFKRMPLGLSGAAPNFQKARDILKLVLGRFVDDVIISSPSFAHHVEYLREILTLLQEEG
ncbi:retrovirus-related Pol polyprotein from transposon opus [Trichonephila clavipes]|nr:retrovirus-related Pol polyprotein from transposon opus [Trichonephila clavipes]